MDIAALGRTVGAELLGIGAEDEGAVGLLGLIIVVIKDTQRRGDSLTQNAAAVLKRAAGEVHVPNFAAADMGREQLLNDGDEVLVRHVAAAVMLGRKGDGGDAVYERLHSRADSAGIGDVKAGVVAEVDAGENDIGLHGHEEVDRELHAVGRCAADAPCVHDRHGESGAAHGKFAENGELL